MQNKNFIESLFLDVLLDKVKDFLPIELKYIELAIIHKSEEYDVEISYLSEDFKDISLDYFFSDEEKETFDEECVDDYIYNGLYFFNDLDGVENDLYAEHEGHFFYKWNRTDININEYPLKQKERLLSELHTERDVLDKQISELSMNIRQLKIDKNK